MIHSKTQATILGIIALAIIAALITLFARNSHHKPDMSVAPDSTAYYSDTDRYRRVDTVVVYRDTVVMYRIPDSTNIEIFNKGYYHTFIMLDGDTLITN